MSLTTIDIAVRYHAVSLALTIETAEHTLAKAKGRAPNSQTNMERARDIQRGWASSGSDSEANTPGGGAGETASGRPTAARSSLSDPAPSLGDAALGGFAASSRPKGKNLTEGGFDPEQAENASFTADIGSKNDPGRESEVKFETPRQAGAPIAKGDTPGGGESERKEGQPYEALGSEKDA